MSDFSPSSLPEQQAARALTYAVPAQYGTNGNGTQPGVFDAAVAVDFITALGKNGTTRIRAFPVKGAAGAGSAQKDDLFLPDGSVNVATIERWQQQQRLGVYFVVNNGGDKKADITEIVAYFAEFDDGTKEEQLRRLNSSPLLTPSYVIDNGGKSLHLYWVLDEPIICRAVADCPNKKQWTAEQVRLNAALGTDSSIKDPSRVMRLPAAWYVRPDGSFGGQARVRAGTGKRYSRQEFLDHLPELPRPISATPLPLQAVIPQPAVQASQNDAERTRRRMLEQLQKVPPRIPSSVDPNSPTKGTRGLYAKLLWAFLDAFGEAEAVRIWSNHSPAWAAAESLTEKCREADGTVKAASFFYEVKEHWGITDPPRAAAPDPFPPLDDPFATQPALPPISKDRDFTFSELVGKVLKAARRNDIDDEMLYRAELKGRLRCTDTQIVQSLFGQLMEEETGSTARLAFGDLDLFSQGDEVLWRVQGYLHDNDQTMIAGANGQGKTRGIIEMGFAIVDGLPFLDRNVPAKQGNVLYILSDGGTATFRGELEKAGYGDHPALKQGGDGYKIKFMAHSIKANTKGWTASIAGCLYLLQYVKDNNTSVVFIDSVKTVCVPGTVSYTDNEGVRAMLTFFKNVICQHCSIVWINHDGFNGEPTAGAKSWREVPSSWHQITPATEKQPGRQKPVLIENRKEWHVRKMRIEETRSFHYGIGSDQRLFVDANYEVVGNCRDELLKTLRMAEIEKQDWLLAKSIKERITTHADKSIANTLSVECSVKDPSIKMRGGGRYSLTKAGRALANQILAAAGAAGTCFL